MCSKVSWHQPQRFSATNIDNLIHKLPSQVVAKDSITDNMDGQRHSAWRRAVNKL